MSRTKKLFTLFAAGMAVMLSSCGDNIIESGGPVSTTATLNVVVRDAVTGDVIDDAEVTLLTAPKAKIKKTVESTVGTVTFQDVHVGNHSVMVIADGYAGVVRGVNVSTDYASYTSDGVFIATDNTAEIEVLPMDAKLTGVLYYSMDGVSYPARQGTRVRVRLDSDIYVERNYEVTTNASGVYTFNALPAVGAAYTITALEQTFPTSTGIAYKATNIGFAVPSLVSGEMAYAADPALKFIYTEPVTPFIYRGATIGNGFITVEREETVELLFSSNIDTDKISLDPIEVRSKGSDVLGVTLEYDANIVKVTPFGQWPLDGFEIFIASNALASFNGNFAPGEVVEVRVVNDDLNTLPAITDLRIDSMTTSAGFVPVWESQSVRLRWSAVTGATSYDVFIKRNDTEDYVRVANGVTSKDNISMFTDVIFDNWNQLEDNRHSLVVQAVNARSKGPLTGAKVVDLFSSPTVDVGYNSLDVPNHAVDVGGPSHAHLASILRDDDSNLLGVYSITFTEPMDVTAAVTGSVSGWNAALRQRVSPTYIWSNDNKTLEVTININGGDALGGSANVRGAFRITNLKSESGVPFFVDYAETPDEERTITGNLEIRFDTH